MSKVMKLPIEGIARLISKERNIDIPIHIPGSVFDALVESGVLPDPFYGINEQTSSWVYESEWTISKGFNIPGEFLKNRHLRICFHGIDTFATIYINGKEIATVDNMHRAWEFDIKGIVKKGTNTLELMFKSPSKIAAQLWLDDNKRLTSPDYSLPGGPYTHKAQYSYGWDWGPKLPDIGIWQNVELVGFDDARVLCVQTIQTFSESYEQVDLAIKTEVELDRVFNEDLDDHISYKTMVKYEFPADISFFMEQEQSDGAFTFSFKPELWWIKELGPPNLYRIIVQLLIDGNIVDEVSTRIGLRDIKLVRRKDEWGESFFFQLNGVPIFAKGANWVPVHSFIPKGKRLGLYKSTIQDAAKAHLNMIRAWGGGIIEDDEFYDECDEQGILVWQDLPYACQTIPAVTDEDGNFNRYYDNAKELAIQAFKRLRNRASLALWCGNNEIEMFLPHGNLESHNPLIGPYVAVFEQLYSSLCETLDPAHAYWPSSPGNGGSGGTGIFPPIPKETTGDNHNWTVWHSGVSFETYRKDFSRFQSEFGFQSFPEMKTCLEFCPEDELTVPSSVMNSHQKDPGGNHKLLTYLKKSYDLPVQFEKVAMISQLMHAEAIEYGAEHWRRNRGTPGKERCMGSLYWQLNDCWPVTSGSSIDYSTHLAEHFGRVGRWKALHYFVKRFFQPMIVSIAESKKDCELWVVNDLVESKKVVIKWQLLQSDGSVLEHGELVADAPPLSSTLLETVDVRQYFGYRGLSISGRLEMADDGKLRFLDSSLPKNGTPFQEWSYLDDVLKEFAGTTVDMSVYLEGQKMAHESVNVLGLSKKSKFSGDCVIDEEGHLCIKQQITAANPALYDIPVMELLDPFIGNEKVIIEVDSFAKNPPLVIVVRMHDQETVVSNTFRLFDSPKQYPFIEPHLALDIIQGSGKDWQVSISTDKLAFHVFLSSEKLDFWADDNFFLMNAQETRIINLIFVETVAEDTLRAEIKVKSLYDLIN
jgi:beta-mannosidase